MIGLIYFRKGDMAWLNSPSLENECTILKNWFFFWWNKWWRWWFFEKWTRHGQMPQFDNQCEFLRNFMHNYFLEWRMGLNKQKTCPKTQNKPKCPRGEWVPFGRVPIGTLNLAPTFCIFWRVFIFFFFFFLFFEKIFFIRSGPWNTFPVYIKLSKLI